MEPSDAGLLKLTLVSVSSSSAVPEDRDNQHRQMTDNCL